MIDIIEMRSNPVGEHSHIVECPICMDTINPEVNCVVTECGHTFHTRCLLTNIVHNGFDCPYCRTVMIDEATLHAISESDDEEVNERDNTLNNLNREFDEDDDDDNESWSASEISSDDETMNDDDDAVENEDEVLPESQNQNMVVTEVATESEILDGMRTMFTHAERRYNNRDSLSRVIGMARLTEREIEAEEHRMLNDSLPTVNIIARELITIHHFDCTFEDLCNTLLRMMLSWQYYSYYGYNIRRNVVERLDDDIRRAIRIILDLPSEEDEEEEENVSNRV